MLSLLLALSAPCPSQTLRTDSLFCPSLGRVKKVNLLLPAGFDGSKRYPVLFLLHGYGGSLTDWIRLTGLMRHVAGLPLIVVMPDAENSWYVNQIEAPSQRFEDYLTRDLWEYVTGKLGIDTTHVAIGGISMGGYGALMLGLRHKDRYSFVGALSGGIDMPAGIRDLAKTGREHLRPSLIQAFGEKPSAYWTAHDVFVLAGGLDSAHAPYLYLATGIQDFLASRLGAYRAFADTLRAHKVSYEYHETPGAHDWTYWDREIRPMLERLQERWKL